MNEQEIRKIVEKAVEKLLTNEGNNSQTGKVAIGADHGGYELKEAMREKLAAAGYTVFDMGTHSKESVDYPDYAAKVARSVQKGEADKGIMIDTAGIGSAMAANKIKGIRAALCYNEKTVLNSRLHNNANVLTLGAAYHTTDEAIKLALLWLKTPFEGGRHQRRIDKIMALEKESL